MGGYWKSFFMHDKSCMFVIQNSDSGLLKTFIIYGKLKLEYLDLNTDQLTLQFKQWFAFNAFLLELDTRLPSESSGSGIVLGFLLEIERS